ncbi:MAG: CoB--CoM heterodisulfide reductase iron-sulfur subunit A family protein, partial [Planctomycetes bacterium]|nr:CoB--CoM heterodisulfide reductase iron-sulfur subunit A family protein [Planctomycetota bacterium]
IDCKKVADLAAGMSNVVFATDLTYSCSPDGLKTIKEKIEEFGVNRVVVASCTPRTHEPLFQETLREAGLNAYLFEMANIRDQCTWVHAKLGNLTEEKAVDLVKMAVGRAKTIEPLVTKTYIPKDSAIVVGGGVGGMTAALSIANQGFAVHLIEKTDLLGGNLRNISGTVEGLKPREFLQDLLSLVQSNNNITVYTNSTVKECKGFIGNFETVVVRDSDEEIGIEHGAAIIAIGAVESKPAEYLYSRNENVLTQMEFEDRIEKDVEFVGDLKEVVMIQCVGSREPDRMICSRICCTEAIKNAISIKKANPGANVAVLYRDMRTYGFKEDYYREASEKGVIFIRYDDEDKPLVSTDGGLSVTVTDPILKEKVKLPADSVVLAAAILPQ